MTYKEREKLINQAFKRRSLLMLNKGKEYSNNNIDVNFNFKEVAKRLGKYRAGTPEYSLGVYLEKAILSMEAWYRGQELSSGESLISRLDDIRNYSDILESLLSDHHKDNFIDYLKR